MRRCASCGSPVPDRRDLHKVRRRGRTARVCPTCARRGTESQAVHRTLVLVAGAGLLVAVLAALDPLRSWTYFALIPLMVLAALALHVVLHEAAHALIARAVGMAVPQVRLGNGPLLLRLRVRGTTIELRGFHSGVTFLEPEGVRWLQSRLALVTAAGPVANLSLAAVAFWVIAPLSGGAELFRTHLYLAGAFLGALNLAPFRFTSAGGLVHSDGWSLLTLLGSRHATSDQVVAAGRLQAAERQHLEGGQVAIAGDASAVLDSEDPQTLGMEGTRRIFTRELDEAITLLRRASELPQEEGQLGLTLNNLAWALVLAQPPDWLDEADRASARAIGIHPWQEATMNTRGCVLVHLGEHAEARDLLRRAIDADASASDRVVQHRHLLEAEHGLGNLFGARSSLFGLVDHGADEMTVDRARALLRPLEVDNALANLVDGTGRIAWPGAREKGAEVRHLREVRRALSDFLDEEDEDPRREAVLVALGAADRMDANP